MTQAWAEACDEPKKNDNCNPRRLQLMQDTTITGTASLTDAIILLLDLHSMHLEFKQCVLKVDHDTPCVHQLSQPHLSLLTTAD